ncbi:MAG: NADH-quinone oxidoreductase subunit F, partial [gamma proteobacterium symbiont of Ctena orbiculata]
MPSAVKSDKREPGHNKGRRVKPAVLAEIRELLGETPRRPELLIELLHRLQDAHGYITIDQVMALAQELNISSAHVYEVASFYHHFDLVGEGETPPPPLTVRVCDSISCMLDGAESLIADLRASLGDGVRVQ